MAGHVTPRSLWQKASDWLAQFLEYMSLSDHDSTYYVVMDTNLFLGRLDELVKIQAQLLGLVGKELLIIVPYTVQKELENIKNDKRISMAAVQKKARDAEIFIEQWTQSGIAVGQDSRDADQSYKSWFSYPIVTKDDRILHCALRYKYTYGKQNVGVFTLDRGMRINARSMKITTFHIPAPEKPKPVRLFKAIKGKASSTKQKRVSPLTLTDDPCEGLTTYFSAVFDHVIGIRKSIRRCLSSKTETSQSRAMSVQSLRLLSMYVDAICAQYKSAHENALKGEDSEDCAALHATMSSFITGYNLNVTGISCLCLYQLFYDEQMSELADNGLTDVAEVQSSVNECKKLLKSDEMWN